MDRQVQALTDRVARQDERIAQLVRRLNRSSRNSSQRHDEAIAAFERALELGRDVAPDERYEIARVLLLAGRHQQADTLWTELRGADPGGVWTLNAGGLACTTGLVDSSS